MSLTVTQRPTQTINSETADWNAVGNPILYKMQRKDFTFASITNSGGFVRLVLDSSFGDVASSFDVNDIVYFQTDAGVYSTTGTVTASSYSAPNTLVTLSTAYISSSTGFVNNETLRPLYGVEVSVYNDSGDVLLNSEAFRYSPTSKGALTIDVSAILRANMIADNDADLTTPADAYTDSNAYLNFYIKYRETWTGSAESLTDDSSNVYGALFGAMQIPSTYGGNVYNYMLLTDVKAAKFLNNMATLKMWDGYPFLLSVLVGGLANNVVLVLKGYDVSNTLVATNNSAATAGTDRVLHWLVDEVYGSLTGVKYIIAHVKDNTTNDILTEEIRIDVLEPCVNPVYLIGRNTLGGALCWMFDFRQEVSYNIGTEKAKRHLLYTDQLTLSQWDALQDFINAGEVYRNNIVEFTSATIKTSTKIGQQVYSVSSTGAKVGVIAMETENTTYTRNTKHSFELEIEYPETFRP